MLMKSNVVQFSNTGKKYQLGQVLVSALENINLSISYGEFVVIMGPSGSGKSTLLNMLGCIDLPSEGSVEVCGHITSDRTEKELAELRRDNIGFIFQAFNLIPVLSVYENIEYALILKNIPRSEHAQRIKKIIDQVGLSSHSHHRPNELSGGQRQRVAIARALVGQPKVVLADEPTANLDSVTGQSILKLMMEMNSLYETTFIFATHDPDVLSFAKRVIRLHDGQIASDDGSPAESKKRKRG